MACVNSDKFSANDWALFIESMEQICRMESLKRQRLQQRRKAKQLNETLSHLDHPYEEESCITLSSRDAPIEESYMENFKDQHIGYNSTCVDPQQYYAVAYNDEYHNEDSMDCHSTIYSMPYDCTASTKLEECNYETLDVRPKEELKHHYEEPSQVVNSVKSKRKLSLFGLVRKKYKKCFSSKTNNWHKSESWTKLTVI